MDNTRFRNKKKCKIYKPRERLKNGDKYQSKPEIGAEIVKELTKVGFKIKRILADSLYGESVSNFLRVIEGLKIDYAVGIRSNHGVWLPKEQRVRANKWRSFKHECSDGKSEIRYIREIIYGKRRQKQYWEITTDCEKIPLDATWFVMTNIPQVKYKEIGNIYKIRAWIEYGFKQSKSELGWADFRLTNYEGIQKWWELVMSVYLMVSLHNENFNPSITTVAKKFKQHDWWDENQGWKNLLNNLRLILQPSVNLNLINPWLKVFPIPQLYWGFSRLIAFMNEFDCLQYLVYFRNDFYLSSA